VAIVIAGAKKKPSNATEHTALLIV